MSSFLAISLCTLELFRLLRLFKPSFSIEAYGKLICSSYAVSLLDISFLHSQFLHIHNFYVRNHLAVATVSCSLMHLMRIYIFCISRSVKSSPHLIATHRIGNSFPDVPHAAIKRDLSLSIGLS